MVLAHPSDPDAICEWPFDAREARAQATVMARMATDLAAFSASLSQPKGRPPENNENRWVKGFGDLISESSRRRTGRQPQTWLDEIARRLFALFFGWEISVSGYRRVRQALAKRGTRAR